MRNSFLYPLMFMLSALDLSGTGAFYFSLHELQKSYLLTDLQLNLLIFPPSIITIIFITQNLRLNDRFGRKTFLNVSLGIYALGCLIGVLCKDYASLLTARYAMAVGAAAFVTTARSLVYEMEGQSNRMRGIKYYASGLAVGMALGPYIASNLSAAHVFQGAFEALGMTSLVCIALNSASKSALLDRSSKLGHHYQSFSSAAIMLSPAISLLGLMTIVPISHDFSNSKHLFLSFAAAWIICTIVVFGVKTDADSFSIKALWKHSRHYRRGIAAFSTCFLIIGFNSFYIFNVFKEAEGFSWDKLGYAYSLGFIASLAAWLFMYHLLPKAKTSKPFWVSGIFLLCGYLWILYRITHNQASTETVTLAVALLGGGTMFVLASTSMLTFSEMQEDRHRFGHAFQIKSILGHVFTLIGVLASQIVFLH